MLENYGNPQVVQVIQTRVWRGDNSVKICEGQTARRLVTQFHSLDGKFLGEGDPAVCPICRENGDIVLFCTSSHK